MQHLRGRIAKSDVRTTYHVPTHPALCLGTSVPRQKWIVSLKHLSHYSCTVTNLLSIIIEAARYSAAFYNYLEERLRRRRKRWRLRVNGNGKLWPMEC